MLTINAEFRGNSAIIYGNEILYLHRTKGTGKI